MARCEGGSLFGLTEQDGGAKVNYFLAAASEADFKFARPFSKSPPTILSMFMKRQKALEIKFLWPVTPNLSDRFSECTGG